LQATLMTANGSFACGVLDFSPSGAKVKFALTLAEKEAVTLMIEPLGTFTGVVVWCGSGCFGMQFLAQTWRAGAVPADIVAAVSAPKARAKLAAYLLAKKGSRSAAEASAADLVSDLRHFLREMRTLMGDEDTDDGDAPAPTR
jgi:PilZ domain-containing protein